MINSFLVRVNVGSPKIHLASASSRRLEMLKKALLGQCVSISASPLVSPEITPLTGLDVGEQVAAVLANKIQSAKVEFSLQLESENSTDKLTTRDVEGK